MQRPYIAATINIYTGMTLPFISTAGTLVPVCTLSHFIDSHILGQLTFSSGRCIIDHARHVRGPLGVEAAKHRCEQPLHHMPQDGASVRQLQHLGVVAIKHLRTAEREGGVDFRSPNTSSRGQRRR